MVNFDLGHIEVGGLEPGGGVLPAQHLAGGGRAPAQVVGPRAGLDIGNNIMHSCSNNANAWLATFLAKSWSTLGSSICFLDQRSCTMLENCSFMLVMLPAL